MPAKKELGLVGKALLGVGVTAAGIIIGGLTVNFLWTKYVVWKAKKDAGAASSQQQSQQQSATNVVPLGNI